jgi:hypothetical protein
MSPMCGVSSIHLQKENLFLKVYSTLAPLRIGKRASIMASAIPAASGRGTRTSALEGGAFENAAVMLRGHKWPIR